MTVGQRELNCHSQLAVTGPDVATLIEKKTHTHNSKKFTTLGLTGKKVVWQQTKEQEAFGGCKIEHVPLDTHRQGHTFELELLYLAQSGGKCLGQKVSKEMPRICCGGSSPYDRLIEEHKNDA